MSITSTQDLLQHSLFKAAKIGNISLMRELIIAGANPFISDDDGYNAIFYASRQEPFKTDNLLLELNNIITKFRSRKD